VEEKEKSIRYPLTREKKDLEKTVIRKNKHLFRDEGKRNTFVPFFLSKKNN
jgi:hypothetical protein